MIFFPVSYLLEQFALCQDNNEVAAHLFVPTASTTGLQQWMCIT